MGICTVNEPVPGKSFKLHKAGLAAAKCSLCLLCLGHGAKRPAQNPKPGAAQSEDWTVGNAVDDINPALPIIRSMP